MECVEMNCYTPFRVLVILALIIPLTSSIISYADSVHMNGPLIVKDLELHRVSPIDASPAVMRLDLFHEGSEPQIRNISYRVSQGEWIEIPDWKERLVANDERSSVNFSIDLDWGGFEIIYVKMIDRMGTNSYVGCPVILSRAPTVDLVVLPDDDIEDLPGEYTFEAHTVDPDGQDVDCIWLVDNETITPGMSFTTYLDEGTHSITAEVTDGQWTVTDELTVDIRQVIPKEENGGISLLTILSLSFLLIVIASIFIFIVYAFHCAYRARWGEGSGIDNNIEIEYDHGSSVCDICIKELKKGQGVIDCRCGAAFHKGCGRREGVCPECGREILI